MFIELATLPIEMQQQFLKVKQGEQLIITQQGEIVTTATINQQPSYANGDFNFDLQRIKKSVDSGRIDIPKSALTDIDSFDNWLNTVTA